MNGRDYLRSFTRWGLAGWTCLGLSLIGLSVWQQYELSRDAYQQRQGHTDSNARDAAQKIADECNIIWPPFDTLRECLAEKITAYTKQDHTDQDLQAQQDMAFWALGTVIVGLISVVIGAFGLIGLFVSLRHTRTAITNDRRIGEAQTRAYLVVKPLVYDKKTRSGQVRLMNTGQTPARNVHHMTAVTLLPWPIDDDPGDLLIAKDGKATPTNIIGAGTNVTVDVIWGDREGVPDAKETCFYGIVFYDDVFGETYKLRFCARWYLVVTPMPTHKIEQDQFEFAKFHNDEQRIKSDNKHH